MRYKLFIKQKAAFNIHDYLMYVMGTIYFKGHLQRTITFNLWYAYTRLNHIKTYSN